MTRAFKNSATTREHGISTLQMTRGCKNATRNTFFGKRYVTTNISFELNTSDLFPNIKETIMFSRLASMKSN